MRWFVIIIVIILLSGAGFFAFNQYIYNQKQGTQMTDTATSPTDTNSFQVIPISHASFVMNIGGQVIYNDPTGGQEAFTGQPVPNIILISDIHGDHFNADTLKAISTQDTIIVVPQAVKDQLPDDIQGTIVVLHNGEKTTQKGIEIEAIPMYNIPESAEAFHTKGRGNGYVVSVEGKRVYIAGDTSATPEMKNLKNIDVAFIPMNLPYTMNVEEAAEGVLAFKPKVVHPYHYRGSDVNKFKELVESKDPGITVELSNFYPGQN